MKREIKREGRGSGRGRERGRRLMKGEMEITEVDSVSFSSE